MIEVTARMAAYTSVGSPGECFSHNTPARSIGSNGSSGIVAG